MKSNETILSPLRGKGNYYNCVDYDDAINAMDIARQDERSKVIGELVEWMEKQEKTNDGALDEFSRGGSLAYFFCITHAKSLLKQEVKN